MRLFIAAELPNSLINALTETSALLREAVRGRYVGNDQFHLTLAFLGEVPASRINELAYIVSRTTSQLAPIPVALGALGCFGKPRSATLWQGISSGEAQLTALANNLRDHLENAGFDFDRKAFLPHVTLMRSANVESGVLPPSAFASGTLDTVTLFQSELFKNDRPRYTPLYTALMGE